MNRRILFTILTSLMLFGLMPQLVLAGPPLPPSNMPRLCAFRGELYAHRHIRKAPVYDINGILQVVDSYQCIDGTWVYVDSQSPGQTQPGQPALVFPDLTCSITSIARFRNQFYFEYSVVNQSNEVAPAVLVQRQVTWHDGLSTVIFDEQSMSMPFPANGVQTYASPSIGPIITGSYEATMEVNGDLQVIEMNIGNNSCSLSTNNYIR